MTFPTDKKNTFKKDYLKGLEYKKPEYKPNSFLLAGAVCVMLAFLCLCVKMCFDEPKTVTMEQLNADRR